MQKTHWIYFCLLAFSYSCISVKPENIKYSSVKRQFEYVRGNHVVSLRNDSNQLIDSTNLEEFQTELMERNYKYPFNERTENGDLLRKSDFRLAQNYSAINSAIQDKKYPVALKHIKLLRNIYPDIDYYSDCSFLEGYTYEKSGKPDSATIAYQKFYTFADKKYSRHFRGHRDDDDYDTKYIAERNYAYSSLNRIPDAFDTTLIQPITPQYYYTSCQPGFTFNPEDYGRDVKYLASVSLGTDMFDDLILGYQITYGLRKSLNFNALAYASRNMHGVLFSLPVQLYKSESNNVGVKLSPFLDYYKIDNIDDVFNFGAKLSASYFIDQNIYIGSYYQYNYYNENHRFFAKKTAISLWTYNEYDISCYYTIVKSLSLKAGIKNSDFVAGLYLGGLEFSYNITNPGFIVKTDFY